MTSPLEPLFRQSCRLFFLIGIVCSSQFTFGQIQPVNPDSALYVLLSRLEGSPLSLKDAVARALDKSTSVRKAEAAYLAAKGTVRRESGVFDPELFFDMNYLDRDEPTASFFSGAPVLVTNQTTTKGGLRWDLPIGTEFEASLNTIRLKTNSTFAFLNPQYTAFGSLSLRQPLLGGFNISARKGLAKAEQEFESAKARYDQEMLTTTSEVERMYWDLYAAERDYAVQQLTKEQGEAFLNEAELRAKAGLIGPSQVANARTFLAEQTILFLEREEQLNRLSDGLASLIGVRPDSDKVRFITTDDPPADFPIEPVDELVERALKSNLNLHAAEADVEAVRTMASAAGWEALPSVAFVGSIGGSGIAGSAQDVIFGTDTLRTTRGGSLGDAVKQVTKRQFPDWSVGVEVKVPIGFRNGLGEQERLEAEVMMAEQRYIERKRALEDEVRANHRELFHGKRRLEAAKEGVEAAQEQVRIGLIEFSNGRSTAFELVRLGADFALAQRRYSEAMVRTAKAATTLRQLTSGGYPAATSN